MSCRYKDKDGICELWEEMGADYGLGEPCGFDGICLVDEFENPLSHCENYEKMKNYDETGESQALAAMERGITETENWRSNL